MEFVREGLMKLGRRVWDVTESPRSDDGSGRVVGGNSVVGASVSATVASVVDVGETTSRGSVDSGDCTRGISAEDLSSNGDMSSCCADGEEASEGWSFVAGAGLPSGDS